MESLSNNTKMSGMLKRGLDELQGSSEVEEATTHQSDMMVESNSVEGNYFI